MQLISDKLNESRNGQQDRQLVAREDLQPGEQLFEEQPLYVTPHWECEQMKCSNCLLDSFVMCKKCKVFPLCIDCEEHDPFDCQFFQKHGSAVSKNLLVQNYAIYATLKLLLLLEREPSAHSLLDDDVGDYSDTKLWQEQTTTVIQPLLDSGLIDCLQHQCQTSVKAEYLHRLCRVIDAHSFEVINAQGDSLKGVYARATKFPHNCVPNALVTLDFDFQLRIHAAVPIKGGEIITVSYVNPLMGTAQRREQLRQSRQLECACVRCKASTTEMGTHLSTIKCVKCNGGQCELPHFDGGNSNWICSKCNAELPAKEVESLLTTAEEELSETEGELKAYELFLEKYALRLHTNHYLLIEAKQQMIGVLRLLLHAAGNSTGRRVEWLQRRIQLCDELLPVVRAVVPGISKLYGIALHEWVASFVQLAELQHAGKEIERHVYEERLLKALAKTQEALDMLACEPNNSAEGQLRQRVASERKRIGQSLQNLAE